MIMETGNFIGVCMIREFAMGHVCHLQRHETLASSMNDYGWLDEFYVRMQVK